VKFLSILRKKKKESVQLENEIDCNEQMEVKKRFKKID